MRRRAQRPCPNEVAECVTLACCRRDECPDPKRLAYLNAKIAAWEEEEKRRKDPIGFIVRRLTAEGGDVTFRDASRADKPLVHLSYYKPERIERRPIETPELVSEFLSVDARKLTVETVLIPKVDLAEDVGISVQMLTDDEWDHEDEICQMLRWHAARLPDTGPAAVTP